jgi:L-iditol 2-dehydrogenase
MRGFTFQGPGEAALTELPDPKPGPGEILLKVESNTVCGTDLRIMRGEKTKGVRLGVVLGHEASGTITELGEGVEGYEVGTLCGVSPIFACGVCRYCQGGLQNLCEQAEVVGYDVNGGLGEWMVIPATGVRAGRLVAAPAGLPPEQLSLAEPLACCLNGLDQYRVEVGDVVVILGAGPIGLFHLQLAVIGGARTVIVSDPSPSRRAVAAELGAHVTVDPTSEDLAEAVADATDGLGAHVAVVCIGRPQLVNDALNLVGKRGRVSIFAGLADKGWAEIEANLIHYKEITLLGAANSGREDYERAVALISSGRIDAARMVTHRFPLDQAAEAIDSVAGGEGIKVAVLPHMASS